MQNTMNTCEKLKASLFSFLSNCFFSRKCPFDFIDCEPEENLRYSNLNSLYKNKFKYLKVCDKCLESISRQTTQNFPTELRGLNFLNIIYSVFPYLGKSKELIHKLKWENEKLADPMAELMYKFLIINLQEKFDFIVPVPGIKTSERNWITSVLLAEKLSELTGIPVENNLLIKLKDTSAHKLTKKGRIKVIKDSYALSELSPKNKKILLIDDLVTSGLTLQTCASLLNKTNTNEIYALTFAKSLFSN